MRIDGTVVVAALALAAAAAALVAAQPPLPTDELSDVAACRLEIVTVTVPSPLTDVILRQGTTAGQPPTPAVIIVNVTSGHRLSATMSMADLVFRTVTEEPRGFATTILPRLRQNASFHFLRIDDNAFGIELPPTPEYSIIVDETVEFAVDPAGFVVPRVCVQERRVLAASAEFVVQATRTPRFFREAVNVAASASIAFATAALLGAPMTEVQLLSVIGASPCARPETRAVGREWMWFLSPFFEYGTEAVIVGNVGTALAAFVLHYLVYRLVRLTTRRGASSDSSADGASTLQSESDAAAAMAMFPSLSIMVANLLIPGVYFTGVFCTLHLRDSTQAPYVAIAPTLIFQPSAAVRGLIGIASVVIGVIVYPALTWWLTRRVSTVATAMTYAEYGDAFDGWPAPLRVLVLPRGSWLPPPMVRRWGDLFCRHTPKFKLWALAPHALLAIVAFVALVDFTSTQDGCSIQHFALAAMLFGIAVATPLLGPYRSASFTALGSIGYGLFGGVLVMDGLLLRRSSDDNDDDDDLAPTPKAIFFFLLVGLISLRVLVEVALHVAETFVWRPRLQEEVEAAAADPSGCLRLDFAALSSSSEDVGFGEAAIEMQKRDARLLAALLFPTAKNEKKKKKRVTFVSESRTTRKKSKRRHSNATLDLFDKRVDAEHTDAPIYDRAVNGFIAPHPLAGVFPDMEEREDLRRVGFFTSSVDGEGGCGDFQRSPRNPSVNVLRDMTPLQALQYEMERVL